MLKVDLRSNEKYYLDGRFFLITKGKVITKDILASGKIISNENCLREGELIGNFFNISSNSNLKLPEIDIEVEALEETTLEEFKFSKKEILNNTIFEKMLSQLIKKSIIKFLYQLYDSKGYILAILKLYANSNNEIPKKEISYENFNISKSQFYLIYSKLKKEKYVTEDKNIIKLDIEKINEYLNHLELDGYSRKD
ncbi:hypothetical protein [Cetobacterium sp.]|uniref:hypothetical protein n=1 Tax=Cetobacterium sp. TaxID=2071632 RepID=UPI003F2EB63B